MKKILIITLTILMVFSLCSVSVLAVTEGEVQSQVAAQGKEKVTGNIFIWFLCAIAFLKVSQKIDSFMSSLGINVGHTGGSMPGELMIAFKGIKGASGGAFGGSSGGHTTNNTSSEVFLSGGLAGAVGRTTERNAASSVTNQQSHTISQRLYNSSVQKGGDFANTVIGAVAKGSIRDQGTITGDRAAEAMTSYFGYTGKANAPQFSETEIGGGRIIGKESIGGGWVTYQGKQCTEYGICTTAARMVYAVLHDEKVILPASMELNGEYGESGLFVGVPCVIGKDGVEEVIELPLTEEEKATFHQCCEGVRKNMEHLKDIK